MKISPNIFIDNNNFKLWNILKVKYSIKLCYSNEPNYIIQIFPKKIFRKQKVLIHVQKELISKEAFSHELLHLLLHYKKIRIYDVLTTEVCKKSFTQQILDGYLRNSISNFLDHSLFFNDFLKMGYSKDSFFNDYDIKKVDLFKIFTIENQFNSKDKIREGIQNFIGTYFSIKCCFNKEFNYQHELQYLKKIENNLYSLLNNFWNHWTILEIKNYDQIEKLITNFVEEFNNWYLSKNIA